MLPDDLLALARHLAFREPKKPKQASLRRAVSTGYYALFHLLVRAGAHRLAPAKPPLLRERVQRAFAHGEMKRVCNQIQRSSLSPTLDQLFSKPLEPELRTVARAFVELQDARHGADYDTSEPIARLEAAQKIYLADQAFEAWDAIKNTPNATIFLAALLLNAKWSWNESE